MKIAVLSGGYSTERDVSLSTGSVVANALADKGHEVAFIDSFMGVPMPAEGVAALFKKRPDYQDVTMNIPSVPPDLPRIWAERVPDTGCILGENVLQVCQAADVVFIALHGKGGEDGQIQACFDSLNIRYTGSGFYACVQAMNKDVAKHLMKARHVPTAPWEHVVGWQHPNWERIARLGFPLVVKPNCGGSSVATYIVHNEDELREALRNAGQVSDDLLVEAYFGGREFCVGILDGKPLTPIEIIPVSGWFDYEKKYQSGMTDEVCPADIPENQTRMLQDAALLVHKSLGLGYYSRIDFKMEADGSFICLEANTLPGLTPASLFPKEAAQAGIPYPDLCEQIVLAALD